MPSLHAPNLIIFIISLIFAIVAVINIYIAIPGFTQHPLWLMTAAYVVLALGCLV